MGEEVGGQEKLEKNGVVCQGKTAAPESPLQPSGTPAAEAKPAEA